MDIPKDVEELLVENESVDNEYRLRDRYVFTSQNRMFISKVKDTSVIDINFTHISSIKSGYKRKWNLTLFGLVMIVGTIILRQCEPQSWLIGPWGRLMYGYEDGSMGGWICYILGVVIIIVGFIWKSPSVKLSASSLSEEEVFTGYKDTLEALFRLVNERRFQEDTVHTKTPDN